MRNSIEFIQQKVWDMGNIIHAPKSISTLFSVSPQNGRPHIEINRDEFILVFEERGCVFAKKKTRDINVLMYWIFEGITSQMAQEYELQHRDLQRDPRRVIFSKQLELMEQLSPDWHRWLKAEIESILKESPYSDS